MTTEEQKQKIWEWLGFKKQKSWWRKKGTVIDYHWLFPEGERLGPLPPLDLNNFFKYAVPKLHVAEIKAGWGGKGYFSAKVALDCEVYYYSGLARDPAEACWSALLKVIDAGGKK